MAARAITCSAPPCSWGRAATLLPCCPRGAEPRVYIVPGISGEPNAINLGRVGNTGFIVGRSGVLAIDTGTSYLHGRALLAAIRSVTDRPVKLALITHTRQEFLFGAAAFREQGIPIAMHQAAADLMASRCGTCLKTLRSLLGEEAMRGTAMFKPDITFTDPQGIDAATPIGRPIQVLYFGHSSGPVTSRCTTAQPHPSSAACSIEAHPDVIDSNLPTWREALRTLKACPPK